MFDYKKENIKNKKFTVLGAGRSGVAVSRILKKNGAVVFLSENNTEEHLPYLDKNILNEENIKYELGGHSNEIYNCNVLIKSPGIPDDAPVIISAEKKGIKIISEIEAAYWFCEYPVVAVTGTNGKTTTTVLTAEILKNGGFDAAACGNTGTAFSDVVLSVQRQITNRKPLNAVIVLEVSSFQLQHIECFKPVVSVILNLTPDHLDRHKSMDEYFQAKLKINKNQLGEDLLVFNYDDVYLNKHISELKSQTDSNSISVKSEIAEFSIKENLYNTNLKTGAYLSEDVIYYFDKTKNIHEPICHIKDIFIKGLHNVSNALASVIAVKKFGLTSNQIKDTLVNFQGVEHRIEFVGEIGGIKFYNDSKATNADSTYVALNSFPGNIILIMGGKMMDINFDLIRETVQKRVRKIFAIGETRFIIKEYFKDITQVELCETLEDSVIQAFKHADEKNIILFSPCFKSFDMFDNFEHRGKEFKKIIKKLSRKDEVQRL